MPADRGGRRRGRAPRRLPRVVPARLSVLDLVAHAGPERAAVREAVRRVPSAPGRGDPPHRPGGTPRADLGLHRDQRARGRHALQHARLVRRRRPPGRPAPQAAADERGAHDLGPRGRARRLRARHAARAPRRAHLLRALDGPQPLRAHRAGPAGPRRGLACDLGDDRRPELGQLRQPDRRRSSTTRWRHRPTSSARRAASTRARSTRSASRASRTRSGSAAACRRSSRPTRPTSPGRTATTRRSCTARSTSGSSRSRSSSRTRPATTRGRTSSPSGSTGGRRRRSLARRRARWTTLTSSARRTTRRRSSTATRSRGCSRRRTRARTGRCRPVCAAGSRAASSCSPGCCSSSRRSPATCGWRSSTPTSSRTARPPR